MHDHNHSAAGQPLRALRIAMTVTAVLLLVQFVGGLLASSLALMADAAHLLADLGAMGLSYAAARLTERPATPSKSYGFHRAEVLAAVVNGVLLLGISAFILYEAYARLRSPSPIKPVLMFLTALAGLGGNLIALTALKTHGQGNLSMRSAYLEVLADTLGTVGVLVASVIIYTTHFEAADPILSAILACAIIPRTLRLLNEGLHILLEGTPRHLDHGSIENSILDVDGVAAVHDLHVWQLGSGIPILTAHVVVKDGAGCDDLLDRITQRLAREFAIDHTTIQIEHSDRAAREEVRF